MIARRRCRGLRCGRNRRAGIALVKDTSAEDGEVAAGAGWIPLVQPAGL